MSAPPLGAQDRLPNDADPPLASHATAPLGEGRALAVRAVALVRAGESRLAVRPSPYDEV